MAFVKYSVCTFVHTLNLYHRFDDIQAVGGEPFVLRPELCDEKVTTGKTGSILCLRSGYKINSFLAIQTLPVFPVVIFSAPA